MRVAFKKNQANSFLKPQQGDTLSVNALTPVQNQLNSLTEAITSLAKNQEATIGKVSQLQAASPEVSSKPKVNSKVIVCYRCNRPGHFARDCRSSVPLGGKFPNRPVTDSRVYSAPNSDAKPRDKCARCRSTQHKLSECRAGLPPKPCFCGAMHWVYDCPHRRPNAQTAAHQGN
jgi:hypothetical protein